MLILLPPSEGKSAPTRGVRLDVDSLSLPVLNPARHAVIDALVELCATEPEKALEILAIPKTQPELVALNTRLRESATARADAVYTGVLYDALAPATLSSAAKRRLSARVMVTSSVFGLVGMGDRIPAYRLSGDAVLPGLALPGLAGSGPGIRAHWRAHLEPAVLEAVGNGLLVDLRSGTYAAFWHPTSIARRTATVRVLHEVNGVRKVVSHFNKATKGRIVRALMEAGANPRTPAGLADALRDLSSAAGPGWTVEVGPAGKNGTRLDVVVQEL